MKKLLAIAAAAAIVAMAGTAMAATANLSVDATVINACTVTDGTLSFGNLDPTNPAMKTATSSGVSITCTKGDAYTVSLDNGSHASGTQARLTNSTDYIPYSVTVPGVSAGTGAAQSLTLTGTIAANSYNTASSGTYTDTMVITVNP